MKAIGYLEAGSIDRDDALLNIDLDTPAASDHDLLVKIEAVSVNPVDYKVRQNRAPIEGQPAVLGRDAVGEVVAVGESVSRFAPGDKVWYADDISRTGTNIRFD